jgi:hypothetical protein
MPLLRDQGKQLVEIVKKVAKANVVPICCRDNLWGGQELQFLRVFVVVGLVTNPGVSVAQSARDTLF